MDQVIYKCSSLFIVVLNGTLMENTIQNFKGFILV